MQTINEKRDRNLKEQRWVYGRTAGKKRKGEMTL